MGFYLYFAARFLPRSYFTCLRASSTAALTALEADAAPMIPSASIICFRNTAWNLHDGLIRDNRTFTVTGHHAPLCSTFVTPLPPPRNVQRLPDEKTAASFTHPISSSSISPISEIRTWCVQRPGYGSTAASMWGDSAQYPSPKVTTI